MNNNYRVPDLPPHHPEYYEDESYMRNCDECGTRYDANINEQMVCETCQAIEEAKMARSYTEEYLNLNETLTRQELVKYFKEKVNYLVEKRDLRFDVVMLRFSSTTMLGHISITPTYMSMTLTPQLTLTRGNANKLIEIIELCKSLEGTN